MTREVATFYACPPDWDVTPADYSKWRERADNAPGRHSSQPAAREVRPERSAPIVSTAAAGVGNLGAWGGLAYLAAENPHPAWGLLLGPLALVNWLMFTALYRAQVAAQSAYRMAALPADHHRHVLELDADSARSLSFDITKGHYEGTRHEGLVEAWTRAKKQEQQRKQQALEAERRKQAEEAAAAIAARAGNRVAELQKALAEKILLDNPAPTVEPVTDHLELRELANARHDKVREAWSAIISDPLNALDHASLFDVSDTRTAAFIAAYGALEDLRAIHPSGIPDRLVASYVEQTRECERLWEDAYAYSSKRGIGFLPAGERDLARKASRLLALAADESAPVGERASAATKAAALLTRITTVTLPEPSRAQIEALTRLQLTA